MSFFALALKRAKIALKACNLFACMYIAIWQRKRKEKTMKAKIVVNVSLNRVKKKLKFRRRNFSIYITFCEIRGKFEIVLYFRAKIS